MTCLPCVRVQIQGKNIIYANTFANGYMKNKIDFYSQLKQTIAVPTRLVSDLCLYP